MVKLEEVEDDELTQAQPGPIEDDDDFVDTDSSFSDSSAGSDDEFDADSAYPPSESFSDRIYALKDMLPPSTRRTLSSTIGKTNSLAKTSATWGAKGLWIAGTSFLLLLVPFAIAYVEEQQIMEQEKEMKAQESLREGLTPGVPAAEGGRGMGVGATL